MTPFSTPHNPTHPLATQAAKDVPWASLQLARLGVWYKSFAPFLNHARGLFIQKIGASDGGVFVVSGHKPGSPKLHLVLDIQKNRSGVSLVPQRPPTQSQPNGFVQLARKHLLNRPIVQAYITLDPVCVVLELEGNHTEGAGDDRANALILDVGHKPPRLCVAKSYSQVPKRYLHIESAFRDHGVFWESLCEWSADWTRTKRRATFEAPGVTCCLFMPSDMVEEGISVEMAPPLVDLSAGSPRTTLDHEGVGFVGLPTHIRRAIRTKMQFLERRLMRQKADIPDPNATAALEKRCEGLKAHLYLWPKGQPMWYVPQDLMATYGLPPVLQLRQGQSPGDLLSGLYHEWDRHKRRQQELSKRIENSKVELEKFQSLVHRATQEREESPTPDPGPSARSLCQELGISWEKMEQDHRDEVAQEQRKLPYRQFQASTGEFIRVAKSAAEGDAMVKLMPSHHFWLHILVGEGSHVWLEKPKKAVPSPVAIREAGILAVHHSKSGRGQSGEVQIALRSDIEKRKDLPPGKVLVRRCTSQMVRYSQSELHTLYQTLKG